MTDKLTAEELARLTEKGHRADMLKTTITEQIDNLRRSILVTFQHTPIDDDAGFRLLRLYLQLLDDFEGKLIGAIATGEKAQIDLQELKQKLN